MCSLPCRSQGAPLVTSVPQQRHNRRHRQPWQKEAREAGEARAQGRQRRQGCKLSAQYRPWPPPRQPASTSPTEIVSHRDPQQQPQPRGVAGDGDWRQPIGGPPCLSATVPATRGRARRRGEALELSPTRRDTQARRRSGVQTSPIRPQRWSHAWQLQTTPSPESTDTSSQSQLA